MSNFPQSYFQNVTQIVSEIDQDIIEKMVDELCALRKRKGRLFFLGVGGSAANCSHAVNDFRKLCNIEAYTPVDNISELTARTNDEGWHTTFSSWLMTSQVNSKDAVFVLSVGGGDKVRNISPNIVFALDIAKANEMKILGIVGHKGGYTAKVGDAVLLVPSVDPKHITPHVESFQAIIWHCLVSHPRLKYKAAKWEDSLSDSTI